MRKTLLSVLVIFILTSLSQIQAQSDEYSEEKPITFKASYTGDVVNSYPGGIKRGSGYLGMINLGISLDTRNAGLWTGGEFFLNAANTHGSRPSGDLIGDYQGISNIEAGNLTFLHELWYKQTLGNFSLLAGLQDLATGFASSDYGALFLNGSFGVHSTIAHNVPAPVFPLTALGLQLQWRFSDAFTAKTAIFDGLPDDFEHNPHNISWKLNSDDGYLSVSEFNYTSDFFNGLQGTWKFGAYFHNHMESADEAGGAVYRDDYGFYFVADQLLIDDPDGKKLAFFTQAGVSPYDRNENNFYLGAGINYSGLMDGRMDDILGIAVAHAGFHNSSRNNETTIEVSYRRQLNAYLFIQPDIQYVINPAGTGESLNNALAGILRVGVGF